MFAPKLVSLGLAAILTAPSGALVLPSSIVSSSPVLALPGKDLKELSAKLAVDQPIEDRIAAAQELASMGKKSLKALPAMIVGLNDPEPQVRSALAEALQAIGKKARVPILEALQTGEYEGTAIDPVAATKVLMGMGKKAMIAVKEHIDGLPLGPEKIDFMTGLEFEGIPYFLESFGADDGAFDVAMMRRLRAMAAAEVRSSESVEDIVEGIKDEDLALAFRTAWLQAPAKEEAARFGAWLGGENPMLAETGLWALGLLGKDAVGQAEGIAAHLGSEDDLVRATALWTLASLTDTGPAAPVPSIPASFPGASKAATEAVDKIGSDEVNLLWTKPGKSLGYRGRVGTKARKLWGLASTWTSGQLPVPPNPDRSKIAPALLATEGRLFEVASTGSPLEAKLASDVLGALGNTEERCRDLWLAWLKTEDTAKVRSALLGLRTIGRDIIMMEEQDEEMPNEALVIQHLENPETMVAAAQLLTNIRTPTAWSAVVERMTRIEGKPPLAMLFAVSRYDAAALRPYMEPMQDLYEKGHYLFAALLIKFKGEAVVSFEKELSSKLADRRMVAVESLGHIGKDARQVLSRLRSMKDKNTIMQKLINDAIKRIQ
ncbi:MAG: HEAT repeat domain-containing protein [Planctomycetota bacterium]